MNAQETDTKTLYLCYVGDGYLSGASDSEEASRIHYWTFCNGLTEDDIAILRVDNVPLPLAKELEAMGTSDQTVGDGYEAARLVWSYVKTVIWEGDNVWL